MTIAQAIAIYTLGALFGPDAHTRPLSSLMGPQASVLSERVGIMGLYYLANGANIHQLTQNSFAAQSVTNPERIVYLKTPADAALGRLRYSRETSWAGPWNSWVALSESLRLLGDLLEYTAPEPSNAPAPQPATPNAPSVSVADLVAAFSGLHLVISLEAQQECAAR